MNIFLRRLNLSHFLILALSSLFVVIVAISMTSRVNAASKETTSSGEHLVTVYDYGQKRGILTRATTLREVFEEANIQVDKNDKVEPGLDETLVASHYDVNVYRARPVTVVDGSVRVKIMSAHQTPEQIAAHANLTLQDEDITTMQVNTDMVSQGAGLQLTVDRATPFTFILYGKKIKAFTQATTVSEMLAQKDITLGDDDTLSVKKEAPIKAGMTVELWRDGVQTITEEKEIKFEVEQIQDADREVGYKKVKTPGVAGMRTVSYEVEMRNGKEFSRKEIQSVVTKEPTKQVEVVGAKSAPVAGPAEVLDRINYWSEKRGIDANRVARIAKCESGFNPRADSGYYKGIFQHDPNYWAARAAKYGQAGASIYDAEAQIIVSTAMMAGGGWSHWGCK